MSTSIVTIKIARIWLSNHIPSLEEAPDPTWVGWNKDLWRGSIIRLHSQLINLDISSFTDNGLWKKANLPAPNRTWRDIRVGDILDLIKIFKNLTAGHLLGRLLGIFSRRGTEDGKLRSPSLRRRSAMIWSGMYTSFRYQDSH